MNKPESVQKILEHFFFRLALIMEATASTVEKIREKSQLLAETRRALGGLMSYELNPLQERRAALAEYERVFGADRASRHVRHALKGPRILRMSADKG